MSDSHFMQRALDLAERGRGHVEPNPLVGAVIVRDGAIVGEGWHERFGGAHAEVNALAQAGDRARGSTCYVTLEPCCHHGKTPPCTGALIRAEVGRVVAAMLDPFPEVAGQGVKALQGAGIRVDFGVGEAQARRLNAPYLTLLEKARPYVHAKWAMTLDGKIASRSGDSKWISSEASRRRVHELRGCMDAIVAGIGTALLDDPLLTARPPGPRVASRVIFDSAARLPVWSQLVRTARELPTVVFCTERAAFSQREWLQAAGCQLIEVPGDAKERVGVEAALRWMGQKRWTNILVEGGSALLGSFFDSRLIDEFHVFVAPKIVGGATARTAVGGLGLEHIASAWELPEWQLERLDGDLYLRGFPKAQSRGQT